MSLDPLVQGLAALRADDAATAAPLLERATAAAPGSARAWYALALARRALGHAHATPAADRALALAPHEPQILILKADLLAASGETDAAARHYAGALRAAGDPARLPTGLAAELRRAQAEVEAHAARHQSRIDNALAQAGFVANRSSPRFARALDLLAGRAQIYHQQPSRFYFPGLAPIEWFDPADFPWASALEAAVPAIRHELGAMLADRATFAPYVEADAIRPGASGEGLVGDMGWSALYLVREGAVQSDNAARCPATMAALAHVPLCDSAGTPSLLFSRLKPGARIPPHTGFLNTRLICHLAVIAPSGCSLRVGGERREWREGALSIFDDTIEHEAENRSAAERTILIFDIWRPELSEEERHLVRALFAATQASAGGMGV
jgi:aspartate beta-hydroxylase